MRGFLVPVVNKFLADRGTHLAAMIAYFALLAFVPLLFLTLSLLAVTGEKDEEGFLVDQLRRSFPASSVDTLVRVVDEVQQSAGAIGAIGGVALVWAALGFFSVVESALNIVYGRPNRSFFRQKLFVLGLTAGALIVLFLGLVTASFGVDLAQDAAVAGPFLAYVYGVAVSSLLVLVFTWSIYTLLTNERLPWRETLPGALVAALLLQASFQLLPLFVRGTSGFAALQAFGGLALLLFWIYLMANVLVFGAEVNWHLARRRRPVEDETAGLA